MWNTIAGSIMTIGGDYDYREGVSVWYRSFLAFQPDADLMADAPLGFQLHALVAFGLFALWPFTRLVHVFSAPVGYLTRPYIVYRSRDVAAGQPQPEAGLVGQRQSPDRSGPKALRPAPGSTQTAHVCEHCGCRGVEPIAQLMDEHFDLLDLSGTIRRLLADDDRMGAWALLGELAERLSDHVQREERGVFRALREQNEFLEAVQELEAEHIDFDEGLSELGLDDPNLETRVASLLDELSLHIDKENLGIFPVTVVTLNATGWATVTAAHDPASAI